jgi:hypothetical protein
MTKEQLKEFRDTDIGVTQDGDFVFTKRGNGRTIVHGPVTFKEAMIISWTVMKDYMEEMKNEQDHY